MQIHFDYLAFLHYLTILSYKHEPRICRLIMLIIYFVKVNYENDPQAALIQFASNAEARRAYNSPEAVLGNRFIKLFWHNKTKNLPPTVQYCMFLFLSYFRGMFLTSKWALIMMKLTTNFIYYFQFIFHFQWILRQDLLV